MSPTETQDPVAEAEVSPSVTSEDSARSTESSAAQIDATMNAFLRGGAQPSVASKPDDADADDDLDSTVDGVSAPTTGDVKPTDAQAPIRGRRGAAAEIARLAAENAKLQTEVETYRPKPVDASAEAQKAAVDREQRYRRLLHKPDTDTDWTGDDWHWLQTEKQTRAMVPELQQHYDQIIADDLKSHQDSYNGWVKSFRQHVANDMASARDLPGVDIAAAQAATTFAERDRIIYAAGVARSADEVQKLRAELTEARRDLAGSIRTPLAGGRSSLGRGQNVDDVMNDWIRRGPR